MGQAMGQRDINAAIAQRIWSATASGDANSLCQFLAEDVVWKTYGNNPLAGEYKGRPAVIEYLARVGNSVDEFIAELKDIYVSETGAMVHYHVTAERGPKTVATDYLLMVKIADGKAIAFSAVPTDQHQNDEFCLGRTLERSRVGLEPLRRAAGVIPVRVGEENALSYELSTPERIRPCEVDR